MTGPERYPSTRASPPASEHDPSSGLPHLPQTEGSLELVEKIGEGGMGQVFRVRDRRFQREAALKLLKPDRQSERIRARFCREARVTAFLDHPSIPPVYEYGQTARGELFILMKLVRGQSLRERLNLRGEPPEDLIGLLEILIKVCEALAHAHKRGVVHRDIKPDNILIGRFGEVYLMDWGLARFGPRSADTKTTMSGEEQRQVFGPELTHEGAVVGTWGYMSPEQASGDAVTTASDVYALGAVLYEMLWDRTPIQSQGLEAVAATMQGQIRYPTRSSLPPELVALCRRCLSTRAEERPRSAGRVAEALRAELHGRGLGGAVSRAPSRRALAAAVAFAALALIAGALYAMGRAENHGLRVALGQVDRRGDGALARELRGLKRALTRSERKPVEAPVAPRPAGSVTADEVLRVVRQSRVLGARFAEPALKRGLAHSAAGRFEAAVRELDRALTLDPLSARAYSFRGVVRHRLKDRPGAMADYNLALALDPEDAEACFNRGFIHELEGRLAEAGRDYDAAIRIDPRQARAYSNRGRLKLNLNDIEGALGDCATAIKIEDRNPETHNTLGNIFDRLGRSADALREYSRAIVMYPRYAEAYSNRGDVLRNLGRPREARADLDKAIEYDAALPEAYYNRSLLAYDRRDYVAALEDLDKTLALNPGFTQAHNNRGVVLKSLGRLVDALESFNEALAIDRRNTDALINRASVYGLQERYPEALADFAAVLKINPKLEPELRPTIASFRALSQE